nr:exodeoxyribonuclease VII small subunit [Bacillota bacterium]
MNAAGQAPDFEQALAALEKIVDRLEREDLSLEQALALFEEGIGLARFCSQRLDEAERKIELLVEQHGQVILAAAPEFEVSDERAQDSPA